VVVAALAVPLTVAAASAHILLSLLRLEGRPERAFERFWCWAVLRIARVGVRVSGAEHLQAGRSFIIMPNHRSWFDIPALHWALGERDTRWVGKKELVPVPFFGWAFGLSRHIVIDRQNREKGIRAIRRAAEMSGGGVSIVIFPEGTRSLTDEMLPFKKGGFHLALDTGLEILPVAISGAEKVLRKRAWLIHSGEVDVVFCEPVAAAGYGKQNLPKLMDVVRERIQTALPPTIAKEVR
jgi:1-acyl-sn-glycerol-3-phosphate acyltransferase